MTVIPTNYDFTVVKGAHWDDTLTFRENGVVMDLSTYSAHLQVRATQASTSTILDLDSGVGGEITLSSTGTLRILVANTVTSSISADEGVYDLELTNGAGSVQRYLQGNVLFLDEVTR